MSLGIVIKSIGFFALVACLCMGCGELRPTHEDAKKAFAELVDVQEAHQRSIAEYAIEQGPQYADIIRQDTTLTLLRWRRRQLQFEYLIDNEPERLRLRRGREGMVTFQWTEADSMRLAETSPSYRQIEQEISVRMPRLRNLKFEDEEVRSFYEALEKTVVIKSLRRVYGRDEQAIVLRYRLSAILKEE